MSIKQLALCFIVVAAACVGAATAHAQATATRSFVSGAGTNNSNCSRTEPCQLFSQALAVTASYGEIDCLDAGGFGTLTINIPVTINCEGISAAGVLVTVQGAPGIVITGTGPVTLIGLDINGTAEGSFGVQVSGAANVSVRNCKIYGWRNDAIYFEPSASGGTLLVDNSFILNNANGVSLINSGAANMSIRNSTISNNGAGVEGAGIFIQPGGGAHAGATIEQTTLAFNAVGLELDGVATAIIGGSTVVNNGRGIWSVNGGTVYSFQNNQIGGNSTDGTPLTAYPGGPLN
jgi:Right handed beta helix region